jgi:hypothetical protein
MSRVITFSRTYPAYHPKAGQQTYFAEKINAHESGCYPKIHTIRKGNRWKVGDMFSPREWTGRPYASKMRTMGPDMIVKHVFTIEKRSITDRYVYINGKKMIDSFLFSTIALNDGLNTEDLKAWLQWPTPFSGQIICWETPAINYLDEQYYAEEIPQYQANA